MNEDSGWLDEQTLQTLRETAIQVGLARETLLGGLPLALRAAIQVRTNLAEQLLEDLRYLNRIRSLDNGDVPLRAWLQTAADLSVPRLEASVFRDVLAQVGDPAGRRGEAGRGGRAASSPALPLFLAKIPFDLVHPGRHELRSILADQYWDRDAIVALLRTTELKPAWYTLSGSADQAWLDILVKTASRGRLPDLLAAVLRDESAAAWHPRLREMLADTPVVPAPSNGPLDWTPPARGDERLLGPESTLLDIAFLETGVARSRAVVRILARFDREIAHGSGFLVSESHILTNHHVLYDEDGSPPSSIEVWLNHEIGLDGRPAKIEEHTGDIESIRANVGDDWALFRLREPLRQACSAIRLAAPSRPVAVGDRVYIIQHPKGGYKQIGLHRNRVTGVDARRIQYLTDTEQGSSGSPVFNHRWELVAIHHRWVDVSKPGSPPEYRNQGVHIGRVVEALPDMANAR
jgi:Trypsin-like peptidase domain/Effector-associated domain 5/Effector-associated domain 1